jgi:hypothetical protein
MTTQTPVATVWEPQLAQRSLPGGLPWPTGDWTPISDNAARVLLTSQTASGSVGEAWIPQPQPGLAERVWITFDEPVAAGPHMAERVVRYQMVPGGIIAATTESPRLADAGQLHGQIVRIKDRLHVDWDTVIDLLGVPRRTFFRYRKRGELPDDRIGDLRSRISFLASAVDEDVDAARVLVATKRVDVKRLLNEARFADARLLFSTVRSEVAAALTTAPVARPLDTVSRHLDALTEVLALPGFEYAVRAVLAIGRHSSSYSVERLQALIEMERAMQQSRAGVEVDEAWDFLPTMKRVDADELRARAASFVASTDFSGEAWRSFVESEAERAWEAYNPVILPPDAVDVLIAAEPADSHFASVGLRSYSQRVSR